MEKRVALVLTGGGARAAYQVGVLKAIAEFLPRRAHCPFQIICGTSAGSLNAVTLAINAKSFRMGVQYLLNTWKNFQARQIYRTDVIGVFNNSILWLTAVILNAFGFKALNRVSLLDNSPLIELMDELLPCEKIQESIDGGYLRALAITASGYGSGESVTFYQGVKQLEPWRRTGRSGIEATIGINHLAGSAALPFMFPAVLINREYFGDGSMRQNAPLSPALHLGATRVMIIGVSNGNHTQHVERGDISEYPSLARIAGHALDSIFLDRMEVDLERLRRVNELVAIMPDDMRQQAKIRQVDEMVITPSQPLEKIAERYEYELPWTIRLLLRLIGAKQRSSGTLVSYLLSEKGYCRALIDLGYQDALKRRDEIAAFLDVQPAPDAGAAQ